MAEPADTGSGAAVARRRRWRRTLIEVASTVLVAVLLAGGIRMFAFQTFFIPTASMTPTLGVYDRILVQKAFFTWHDVREGDIVVFSHPPLDTCGGPQEGGDLVKRVIALPGQTIYSSGNSIYIDGRRLAEPYLPHDDPLGPQIPHASSRHPYQVPPGEFYVLGDNRSYSCDSRYWGPITGSSIVGKVVLTWWRNSHPDFHLFLRWATEAAARAMPGENMAAGQLDGPILMTETANAPGTASHMPHTRARRHWHAVAFAATASQPPPTTSAARHPTNRYLMYVVERVS